MPAISYCCGPTQILGSKSPQTGHACVANQKHLPKAFVCCFNFLAQAIDCRAPSFKGDRSPCHVCSIRSVLGVLFTSNPAACLHQRERQGVVKQDKGAAPRSRGTCCKYLTGLQVDVSLPRRTNLRPQRLHLHGKTEIEGSDQAKTARSAWHVCSWSVSKNICIGIM